MNIKCEKCGQIYEAGPKYTGKTVQCQCGESIPVYWCVAHAIRTIAADDKNFPSSLITDIGTGYSWAAHWKAKDLEKQYGERVRGVFEAFEVWYYPVGAFPEFVSWFPRFRDERIREAASAGKSLPVLPADPDLSGTGAQKYRGRKICFTGFFADDKITIKKICSALEITSVSSVSGKVDMLVCGPNKGPSKLEKAQELGIPIVSAEVFSADLGKK